MRPIIATFRSVRDKENILRHTSSSRILKQKGIFVTEDFSNKRTVPKGAAAASGHKGAISEVNHQSIFVLQLGQCNLPNISAVLQFTNLLFPVLQKLKNAEDKVKGNLKNIKAVNNNNPDRSQLESSAGMSDQMSSCNSDYAPSSNSGNSSSGNYTDD